MKLYICAPYEVLSIMVLGHPFFKPNYSLHLICTHLKIIHYFNLCLVSVLEYKEKLYKKKTCLIKKIKTEI
jgi:hypothetical protein